MPVLALNKQTNKHILNFKLNMITWHDLYTVLTAVVPLYVAMILAYGSVRWWKIFTPDQCSGINRFVAIFAVPLLSFHFISANNPYAMNFRFIAADTLQKVIMLIILGLWANFTKSGSFDWSITIFSLSTLPNTLVMGIPLLIAMYDDYAGSLMVQVIVLQCIIWYTLLLFLFEYRGAKALITEQFPDTADSIVSIKVDSDVVSLDDKDFIETEAEIGEDGKIHLTVRKSNASRRSLGSALTPRPSNLTGAEIYSLSSSRNHTPRGSNFNNSDFHSVTGRLSNFGSGDFYSVQSSSRGPTPRQSNFEENSEGQTKIGFYPAPNPEISTGISKSSKTTSQGQNKTSRDAKELHMFVWSSGASPLSDVASLHVFGGDNSAGHEQSISWRSDRSPKEITPIVDRPQNNETRGTRNSVGFGNEESDTVAMNPKNESGREKRMPPASVMSRLILIMVWRKLIRNPNTYSSLIGLVWSLIAFRWKVGMPIIIKKSISILSDAGLGMAMFSLGLFMALQPKMIACGKSVASVAMAVRFLAGPAVMAVASLVIRLRGDLLRIAIVQAALPQGIVPFVFAKEYNVHPTILSTAVIFGMLVALPTTLVYYILLGLL